MRSLIITLKLVAIIVLVPCMVILIIIGIICSIPGYLLGRELDD